VRQARFPSQVWNEMTYPWADASRDGSAFARIAIVHIIDVYSYHEYNSDSSST